MPAGNPTGHRCGPEESAMAGDAAADEPGVVTKLSPRPVAATGSAPAWPETLRPSARSLTPSSPRRCRERRRVAGERAAPPEALCKACCHMNAKEHTDMTAPPEPQPVLNPLTRAAIFLVVA